MILTLSFFMLMCIICPNVNAQCTTSCGFYGSCQTNGTCSCILNYIGSQCQFQNPCGTNTCNKNGNCTQLISDYGTDLESVGYVCTCYPGYTGKNCETQTGSNPCLSSPSPCLNNGVCSVIPQTNSYECTCKPPYSGPTCAVYNDYCNGNKCENNALCAPDPTNHNYTCVCKTGFYGSYCQYKINYCLQVGSNGVAFNPCRNNATCIDLATSYECICNGPYSGVNCTELTNPCSSNPCYGGTCNLNSTGTGYTCKCNTGYFGSAKCEPNPCLSNPCLLNSSQCVPIISGLLIPANPYCNSTSPSFICICASNHTQYANVNC